MRRYAGKFKNQITVNVSSTAHHHLFKFNIIYRLSLFLINFLYIQFNKTALNVSLYFEHNTPVNQIGRIQRKWRTQAFKPVLKPGIGAPSTDGFTRKCA